MMILRSFLVLVCLASHGHLAQANVFQSIDGLQQSIKQYTTSHFAAIHSNKIAGEDLFITVGNLDPRLRLAKCDDALVFKVNKPPHSTSNFTVKVSCQKHSRWTIYAPVSIEIYDEVVAAAHPLEKGIVLTKDDLTFKRVNIAGIGFGQVLDKKRLIGMELKRPLRLGDSLKLSFVKPTNVVSKGDSVVLEAKLAALTVSASGTALGNGHIGKQIKVRNDSSERVVDALVVAPGKVRVSSNW